MSAANPRALQLTEIASVRAILKHSSEVYIPLLSFATNELPPVPGIASDHAPSTLIKRSILTKAAISSFPPVSSHCLVITYFQPIPHIPNCSVRAFNLHIGLMSDLPFNRPPVMGLMASAGGLRTAL